MARNAGNGGLNSLLGTGAECEGTARVEGTLRIDGKFTGHLEVGETLIIGSTGSFSGTACGRQVVIAGQFEGDLLGIEQVELQKGARLDGDVLTPAFIIEPGVWFQGNCRMEFTESDASRLRTSPENGGPAGEDPLVRTLPAATEGAAEM